MSKFNYPIPDQNFIICGKQIGAILTDELSQQYDSFDDWVFWERSTPFSNEETIQINVMCSTQDFGNFNNQTKEGVTTYFIDVYVDNKNATLIQEIAGKICYIFNNSEYKTLGFPLGFIGGSGVNSLQFDTSVNQQDSDDFRMCRITLDCRIYESSQYELGIPLLENNTGVKLDLTDKGYNYIKYFN